MRKKFYEGVPVSLRLHPKQYALLRRRADNKGLTVSEFVRQNLKLEKETERPAFEKVMARGIAEILSELRKGKKQRTTAL